MAMKRKAACMATAASASASESEDSDAPFGFAPGEDQPEGVAKKVISVVPSWKACGVAVGDVTVKDFSAFDVHKGYVF